MITTLISAEELLSQLHSTECAIFDCRFTLGDSQRGRQDYLKSHIPGAVYTHLEEDLSAPVIPGITGRHPLLPVDTLVERFSRWGIAPGVQVVAYDDWPGIGLSTAARLWWMLRWLGHDAVAVLDGGWGRWQALGLPVRKGEESYPARQFKPNLRATLIATSDDVDRMRQDSRYRVFDSRGADRFRGENETIDPVAGHIPGAISAPYTESNLPDGLFRPEDELKARFNALLGGVPAANVVFYCGSGVTAAHNVLALAHAGLGDARLYVGSWSEWITDPQRPVAR